MAPESRWLWGFSLGAALLLAWWTLRSTSLPAYSFLLALAAVAVAFAWPAGAGWPRFVCAAILAFNGGAFTLVSSLTLGTLLGRGQVELGEGDGRWLAALGVAALVSAFASLFAQHRGERTASALAAARHAELVAEIRASRLTHARLPARDLALLVAAALILRGAEGSRRRR
ncbi:hypothetical protein JO380_000655 [Cellulomonas iranensis]|uniref:Uncharacterized protein n=1 Tax=Cellulomonas iranensis TaxID=76862 RepID=A0ABU0GFY8_9CELL|nr:hypothetical protein [Cellulomonas iranensis]